VRLLSGPTSMLWNTQVWTALFGLFLYLTHPLIFLNLPNPTDPFQFKPHLCQRSREKTLLSFRAQLEKWFCHVLAVWLWARPLTFLAFHFATCKEEKTALASYGHFKDEMKCYDVPSSVTGTEYMLHGSCYWSSLILNDACCPSLPSSPRSEMWPQHTACTEPRGLHSSGMDILTLNYTIQLSKAGTHFSLPSARHSTADIMWSLCGKRQNFTCEALLSSYLANPTSNPSGGSPGTWPHPQRGISSPDSL